MREWRDVAGFEGRYQVSSDGYVRSLPDVDERGRCMPGVILRPKITEKGYLCVLLDDRKSRRVHRLVASAFIPNPSGLPQVNHLDGIKSNNRFTNLVWCSNADNQQHRYEVLKHRPAMLGKTGAACPNSKPVVGICKMTGVATRYAGAADAARALGITQSGISGAARGTTSSGGAMSYKGYFWQYE